MGDREEWREKFEPIGEDLLGWWHTSGKEDLVGGVPMTVDKEGIRGLELVIGPTIIKGTGRDGAELAKAIKVITSLKEGAIREKLARGAPGVGEDGKGLEPVIGKVEEGGVGSAVTARKGMVGGVEVAVALGGRMASKRRRGVSLKATEGPERNKELEIWDLESYLYNQVRFRVGHIIIRTRPEPISDFISKIHTHP